MADKSIPMDKQQPEVCELKATDKPKPCCVCLDEKDARDECLLFKGLDSEECKPYIEKYKKCMEGFGFKI